MAIPYPEGECFFKRSALSMDGGFDADDEEQFYKYFLVEYIWNRPADHGAWAASNPDNKKHRRSGYKVVKGSGWGTNYGNYEFLPFIYGEPARDPSSSGSVMTRRHNLCISGNRFRDQEKGDALEAWFMPMPLPTKQERWVWIDMLACIRAIYIPVSYYASKDYPEFSTWVMVNFAMDGGKSIFHMDKMKFRNHSTHRTLGLGVWRTWTVGFDIHGMVELLCIPRTMRKSDVNVYSQKFIKFVPSNDIWATGGASDYEFSDSKDFDYTKVLEANTGLDVMWGTVPKGDNFLASFFRNAIAFGLGFIPGIGPVLSVSFLLGWSFVEGAVNEDDSFLDELKLWAPGVGFTIQYARDLRQSTDESREMVDPRWVKASAAQIQEELERMKSIMQQEQEPEQGSGPTKFFLQRFEELAATGTKRLPSREDDGPGEVISEIPATGDTDAATENS